MSGWLTSGVVLEFCWLRSQIFQEVWVADFSEEVDADSAWGEGKALVRGVKHRSRFLPGYGAVVPEVGAALIWAL